jgi:hypothetical protein
MKTLDESMFMRSLADMAAALLKDSVDSERPQVGEFTRPFTDQEEYLSACLVSAGQVGTVCDQLHYALAYLSGYRARKTLGGAPITRADYIAYQMENLLLRLGMIPDRSLRLTNEVFRLGLPPRECGTRTITENQRLRGTSVRTRLRTLDKIVEPYRQARNTIAHHSRYNEPALAKFEVFSVLQKCEHPPDDSVLDRSRHLYKRKADTYIDAKREEFTPVVNKLVAEVAQLFDALLPHFKREHAALK